MKKINLMIVIMIALSFFFNLYSTEVSGEQSGVWSIENSPYVVTGDVNVPSGMTLTIQPGVMVLFNNNTQLTVNGKISAVGTLNDSIRFQTNDNGFWNGIRIESSMENNQFYYCYFSGTGLGNYAISSIESKFLARFVHVENCYEGIQLFDFSTTNEPPQMEILNCKINSIQKSGIYIVGNSNAVISGNDISYCGLDEQYYGAIQLSTQADNHNNVPIIQNNHIHNNAKQGITEANLLNSGNISPIITNNVIENNLTGIYLYNGHGYINQNIIRNNFIEGDSNSGAGVMLYGETSYATFTENEIYGNYTGFYIINNAGANLGDLTNDCSDDDGMNKIHNNVYQGNISSVYCNTNQNIMAQNNFWGTTNTEEIDASIIDSNDNSGDGSVNYLPIFDPESSISISGNISYNENEPVQYYAVGLFLEGQSFDDEPLDYDLLENVGEYHLYTDEPGNYFVAGLAFFTNHIGDPDFDHPDLLTAFGGVTSPQLITVNSGDNLTGIDMEFTSEKPETTLSIDENYQEAGHDIYKVWISQFFQINQFAFNLYHEDNATKIYAFSHMENGVEQMMILDQEAIFVPDSLSVGDTFLTAEIGDDGINYVNAECVGTQQLEINGENKTAYIVDYLHQDQLTSRRWFVNGIGLVQLNDYDTDDNHSGSDFRFTLSNLNVNDTNILMPLSISNFWEYPYDESLCNPDFLWYKTIDNAQVQLSWCPPRYVDADTWLYYNLYIDGELLSTIPISQSTINIDNEGDHQYYLTVVSNIGESLPTNIITIEAVGNSENDIHKPICSLSQNYPNPFNPIGFGRGSGTKISFSIPEENNVELTIYNIKGQKVRNLVNQEFSKGKHEIFWDGKNDNKKVISSGIYFYRMKSGKYVSTKKMLLIK